MHPSHPVLNDHSLLVVVGAVLAVAALALFAVTPNKQTNDVKKAKVLRKVHPNPGKPVSIARSDFRGYKTRADGSQTTYFNRTLTDADKNLLGDCRPKRIDGVASAQPHAQSRAAVWNAGGTWEEKNKTKWAVRRLKELLQEIACAGVHVTSVDFEPDAADASVTFVRGKKKYLFDFGAVRIGCRSVSSGIQATCVLPDVASDCMGEYEMEFEGVATHTNRKAEDELKTRLRDGFHDAAAAQIDAFVAEFHRL
jgi:hypothetical protein